MDVPARPILFAALGVTSIVALVATRVPLLAALCTIPVGVVGMAIIQHNRLKSPKPRAAHECTGCGYDLRGLPLHEHKCPECGQRRRYH